MNWKGLSKGSTVSVKLPLKIDDKFLDYSKFIRITSGGVRISQNYVKTFNYNFDEVVKYFTEVFEIKPKITSKREILFCSCVLTHLFSKILVKVK